MHTRLRTSKPAHPRRLGLRAIAVLTALSSGCSFMFVDKAPAHHEQMPYFECTSGKGWPRTDLVGGIAAGVLGLTLLAASAAFSGWGEPSPEEDAQLIGLPLLSSAVLLSSSYVGYERVEECRQAKDALMWRSYRMQAPYGQPLQPYPYPWPPR
jgi:hypothetical protein